MHKFEYHLNLHYSQTDTCYFYNRSAFEYHLNLHYSQTIHSRFYFVLCLSTI